jgi:hypothetical protein
MVELIYRVKEQLALYDDKYILNKHHGYGDIRLLYPKINNLSILNDVLFREYVASRRLHTPCLSEKELQSLKERIIDRVCDVNSNIKRLDIDIDTSGFNNWALANPNCVPKEKWEIFCHDYICDIGFELVARDLGECLVFDITQQDISPNLLFLISFHNEYCTTNLNPKRENIECELEYNVLKDGFNCNIDYTTYKKVYECFQSHELIKEFYACGVELGYDNNKQCVDIKVSPKKSYAICDLPTKEVSDLQQVMNLRQGYTTAPEIIEKIKNELNGD